MAISISPRQMTERHLKLLLYDTGRCVLWLQLAANDGRTWALKRA